MVSGSKDNQQPVKLWDPKAGQGISTLYDSYTTLSLIYCVLIVCANRTLNNLWCYKMLVLLGVKIDIICMLFLIVLHYAVIPAVLCRNSF